MANAIVKAQVSIVHMEISPISKLDEVWSPTVFIHDIPWQVQAYKDEEMQSFAVFLRCVKDDDSSNWTVPASATIRLLSIAQKNAFYEHTIEPYVFSPSGLSFGKSALIQWDELMKNYVQDDKIEMKVEIIAEDPNYVDRSILRVETIDKSCDCGSHATLRLTVANVDNLLAVRSPQFILRGLPWTLSIYKHQTSTLEAMLSTESAEEVSCRKKMTIALLSSKQQADRIEESNEDRTEVLFVSDIIAWDELMAPKNRFVNNNSITLQVKIEVGQPDGDVANIGSQNVIKRGRFECSICFESLDNQDISTTPCGHLFCSDCIGTAVRNRKACPLCQKPVQLNGLRRLYLPS